MLFRSLLEDVIKELGSPEVSDRFNRLVSLADANDDIWHFLDLKDGTSRRVLVGSCSNFWRAIENHTVCLQSRSQTCAKRESCHQSFRYQSGCDCLLAPALGKNILDHVIDYLKTQSNHASARRTCTSKNSNQWLALGARLSAWGAAMPKVRS